MPKFVIHTVQNIKRTYYVEVDNVDWAYDALCMGELQDYAQEYLTEDVIDTRKVDRWEPVEQTRHVGVNGATYSYNYETNEWVQTVRWDLDRTEVEDPLFL